MQAITPIHLSLLPPHYCGAVSVQEEWLLPRLGLRGKLPGVAVGDKASA